MDEVRGERDHQLALEQRLAHERQIEVLQVAQPAVHQLAGATGRPGGKVGALDERHAESARSGVERHPRAGDATADHHEIELVLGEGGQSLGARNHASQSGMVGGELCGWGDFSRRRATPPTLRVERWQPTAPGAT